MFKSYFIAASLTGAMLFAEAVSVDAKLAVVIIDESELKV